MNERKSDIYKLLPDEYVPKTILFRADQERHVDDIESTLDYPMICKPDIGYKGHKVMRVDNDAELDEMLKEYKDGDLLVQEYLSESREYSIMYYRILSSGESGITSFVEKHMPTIQGDGKRTIEALINDLGNPFINTEWIFRKLGNRRSKILESGKSLVVDHIGNYSRGSKFEDLRAQIDDDLLSAMNDFFDKVPGINFARLDIKSNSVEDIKAGRFRILEINGAKSEPIHIYDPRVGFTKIVSDISFHWKILFRVVKDNIASMDHPSSIEGLKSYRRLKRIMDL